MKKLSVKLIVFTTAVIMIASLSLVACQPTAPAETTAETKETVAETKAEETAAPAEKFKIGVLAANFNDKWMSYMHKAITDYAATVTDIAEVTMVDAEDSYEKQISQAEDFIAQGVDALVLIPINTVEDSPIVDMCKTAGIPLISVNRQLKNQAGAAVYVGSDSIVAGELQMGYLAEVTEGKGNIIIVQGQLNHEAAINRTKGFENVMAKNPDMKEVARDTCNWNRDEAQTLMENWLQSGLEFNIVACNNDEGAIGSILGMQSQNVDPKPYFIGGVDATPDALDYLNQGLLDCTVYQDAVGQGKGGVEAAVKILQGETVPDIVWIPYQLVRPEDYETFKAKWE